MHIESGARGMKILRAPDTAFDGLSDYPFEAHYA